ncbi:hypothetical protein B0F90DRAFT_996199 [Multifurca ochricompacta]|uniref:DUF6534 domain-containing protein n=1 Tax=Multifurca ochricompacta TaxID=376703 RepID=A0AAD4M260_9AGAM|nr:hypothetical protein B0F90DRAFT_996199 [Multifurca ochricompacta]
MSNLAPLVPFQPGLPQSEAGVLSPGIVGLFVQGLETGLVIAHFSRWFSSMERNEGLVISITIVFVTAVGLAQTGIVLMGTLSRYVHNFGQPIYIGWVDYAQQIPTLIMTIPVQALMMRRCYHVVRKNMYIITPFALLFIFSIALSLWSIIITFKVFLPIEDQKNYLGLPKTTGMSYLYIITLILPSVLDIALTGILFYYLTRSMKQVYTAQIRRRIAGLMTTVWQSAVPPTLCTIFLAVLYIQYCNTREKKLELWFPVIQAMIGKLYVLSLFYMTSDFAPPAEERLATYISTLTVPVEAIDTSTFDSRVGGTFSYSHNVTFGSQEVTV